MNYCITVLNVSDSEIVYSSVFALLNELGDEREDLGVMDREKITRDWGRHPDGIIIFAAFSQPGNLLGLVTVSEVFAIFGNGMIGVINEMYVVPVARSAGIGKALLDRVKVLARERRWSRIDVTAPEDARWTRTRAFYEREGFAFAGPKLKFKL